VTLRLSLDAQGATLRAINPARDRLLGADPPGARSPQLRAQPRHD
jgi:hypothetical protein